MPLLLKMFVDFFVGILNFIIGLFPTIKFPSADELNFSAFSDALAYFDTLVSFKLVLACIAAIVVVDNLSFLTRILRFILSKFSLG
ncbi:hypothetical protein P7H50_14125 [Enterococcus durans]|uniref:hypothetical protein n=1 Tax=Enterococcus durans TaxID=53345 RepID=UPI00288FC844|nr:hypothetical protein [Enterococcus durans]MDT2837989.1 hypothetical protein [Enterococcus durans]